MIIYDIFLSLGKYYSESDIWKSLFKNNQLYNLDCLNILYIILIKH